MVPLPAVICSCLPCLLQASYGSRCTEYSISGAVCLNTRVVAMGWYGLEYASLNDDDEAGETDTSARSEERARGHGGFTRCNPSGHCCERTEEQVRRLLPADNAVVQTAGNVP